MVYYHVVGPIPMPVNAADLEKAINNGIKTLGVSGLRFVTITLADPKNPSLGVYLIFQED